MFGFSSSCLVGIGSGDNPQTKVLTEGALLSLGTSFVLMRDNFLIDDDSHHHRNPLMNAMYDGFDRPFEFGCRTNGAMVWDRVRKMYNDCGDDFAQAEQILQTTPAAECEHLCVWQPEPESLPPCSHSIGPITTGKFSHDYSGIVDSSLASLFLHSGGSLLAQGSTTASTTALHVSGGPATSKAVLNRIAAIWDTPVVTVDTSGGAALGAAVSGAYAFLLANGSRHQQQWSTPSQFASQFVTSSSSSITPDFKMSTRFKKYCETLSSFFELNK